MTSAAPFAPFTDFQATPAEAQRLRDLLYADMAANLDQRFKFFLEQNAPLAMNRLRFVPLIVENGFTTLGVERAEAPDLAFTVGLHYALGLPDVMFLDAGGAGLDALQPAVDQVGEQLSAEREDPDDELDPEQATELVARATRAVCERLGLSVQEVFAADEAFLTEHPYGYGSYFYSHFMDTARVPLVAARIG